MQRALGLGFLFLVIAAGCQLPPERMAVRLLPEDTAPLTYLELISRARLQATAGNEAFYVNQWSELEDSARALEQTCRFLLKATEVPAGKKEALPRDADELRQDAVKLREAAKAKNVTQTNELLQRINLKVRQLRVEGS
jgi:hypothetical protein